MYVSCTDAEAMARAVAAQPVTPGEVVVLFVAEGGGTDLEALVAALRPLGVPFCGGLFPGVIHGGRRWDRGAVVQVWPALEAPQVVTDLDRNWAVTPPAFGGAVLARPPGRATALVLVDGLAPHVSAFLAALYRRFGDAVHYVGGGAGSGSLRPGPCLFSNEGVHRQAALVTFLDLASSMGVRHGWERLMGPFVATRTRHNVILDLNWSPAFEVYRAVVEADAGRPLTPETFFDVARAYPFGLCREASEDLVRDPVSVTPGGGLLCVGEVPENALLYILRGRRATLLASAAQAAKACLPGPIPAIHTGLVVDCISRALFLEADYERELARVAAVFADHHLAAPEGVLTLGEVSSHGTGLLEFFNKTIVTGILYEQAAAP